MIEVLRANSGACLLTEHVRDGARGVPHFPVSLPCGMA